MASIASVCRSDSELEYPSNQHDQTLNPVVYAEGLLGDELTARLHQWVIAQLQGLTDQTLKPPFLSLLWKLSLHHRAARARVANLSRTS